MIKFSDFMPVDFPDKTKVKFNMNAGNTALRAWDYGRQKGWEREKAATGSDNSAAKIPDGFVEITEQIEMPF